MWKYNSIIFVFLLTVDHAARASSSSGLRPPPVPLIIDTDIGGGGCMDVDDVGAVCVAHALADLGEADLLAIVVNTAPSDCVGVVSVINQYYGRADMPIGAYKGAGLSGSPTLPYVKELTSGQWNFSRGIRFKSQVPEATVVYRRALAQSQNHSVVISSIGLLTNLQNLLLSGPDEISPLSGLDLVTSKVKLLAVMGGKYPSSAHTNAECNMCGCAWSRGNDALTASEAASYVVKNWPKSIRIQFSGFEIGIQVQSGGTPLSKMPLNNPCRAAYINYEGGPNRSRYSWDPLNTLAAVRGYSGASCRECSNCSGYNTVDPKTGNNAWIPGAASNSTYLILEDAAAAESALDQLLTKPPIHNIDI